MASRRPVAPIAITTNTTTRSTGEGRAAPQERPPLPLELIRLPRNRQRVWRCPVQATSAHGETTPSLLHHPTSLKRGEMSESQGTEQGGGQGGSQGGGQGGGPGSGAGHGGQGGGGPAAAKSRHKHQAKGGLWPLFGLLGPEDLGTSGSRTVKRKDDEVSARLIRKKRMSIQSSNAHTTAREAGKWADGQAEDRGYRTRSREGMMPSRAAKITRPREVSAGRRDEVPARAGARVWVSVQRGVSASRTRRCFSQVKDNAPSPRRPSGRRA